MSLTTAPDFADVHTGTDQFREYLKAAGKILNRHDPDCCFSIYPRHTHSIAGWHTGTVLLLESGEGRQVIMQPMTVEVARSQGALPSTWAIGSNGETVAVRYAIASLHAACGVVVTSPEFQAKLRAIAAEFADTGLGEHLELTIDPMLLGIDLRAGDFTSETSQPGGATLTVDVITRPHDLDPDDGTIACWSRWPASSALGLTGLVPSGNCDHGTGGRP